MRSLQEIFAEVDASPEKCAFIPALEVAAVIPQLIHLPSWGMVEVRKLGCGYSWTWFDGHDC